MKVMMVRGGLKYELSDEQAVLVEEAIRKQKKFIEIDGSLIMIDSIYAVVPKKEVWF